MSNASTPSASGPGLKRVLGLSSLVLYGIILIQPTAPMPLFGAAANLAQGHVVTTVLIGMCAMMFTAISYGRMANVYPNAGSAYTYVGREIHPSMGYFIGWGMIFDYVMNPIICVIWASKASMNFIPEIPFAVYAVFFAVLFTVMNLRGIEASAKTNTVIAVGLGIVIVLFLGSAIRYLFLNPPASAADWTRPFYNPETFSFKTVSTGASLAVLTYIGFDGISTLSEEVHNPRKNILLASVLVCIITGVLAAIQVYTAQMVWPETTFPDQDTAFCFVAGKAGGQWLFNLVNVALLIATIGSGSGAHLGAGRLLYGMGRDNAIPSKFFAKVHPRKRIPANNIILVGIFVLIGAFTLTYPLGAQLLNFGALIAFMGVNASSFVHYFLRGKRTFSNFIVPALGFTICFYLWLSLGISAKIVGICWLSLGVLYGAYRTSWFRKPLQFARIETDENVK
ncbi:MAG TPA: APC family permease [Bacteroidales bacterium]|nr:APC family permease [Bacteroidales bacterium]HOX75771.1 APC family permease [Bacteroidales bacterium]HPM88935.1 APC family permease [Bacteroidales bacterium]HQM70827.1 APC family permease [Bacteroidales bacterium]